MQSYYFDKAFVRGAWQQGVRIAVQDGLILSVDPSGDISGAEHVRGAAIPAMANIHSHAFQRSFAGMAEQRHEGQSDFWAWREAMYAASKSMTPARLEAVAAGLFMECLKGGYSHITEFHYLHGADMGLELAMAEALFAAADTAGVGLTLLPVVYNRGGFGNEPLNSAQQSFHLPIDRLQKLLEDLAPHTSGKHILGLAFHSMRAVGLSDMRAAYKLIGNDAPIHIHIAEQQKEVADCFAAHDVTPIQWLVENMPVDQRWTLIHATHLLSEEVEEIVKHGAVVGLCPTTEANLGDGLFPVDDFLSQQGRLAIGSDSNVCRSAAEELRLMEYGLRLRFNKRTIAKSSDTDSIGTGLWRNAALNGHGAAGSSAGDIAVGKRADILVLDTNNLALTGKPDSSLLDSYIFAGNDSAVRHMMVDGKWSIRAGNHAEEDAISANFRAAIKELAL